MDFELYFILPITVPKELERLSLGESWKTLVMIWREVRRELRGRRCQCEAVRYSRQEMAVE